MNPSRPWPCQTPVEVDLDGQQFVAREPSTARQTSEPVPERLVAALYRLLRDHVHPGDLEQVLLDIHNAEGASYTNGHLEGLARAHAAYLLGERETEGETSPSLEEDAAKRQIERE